MRRLILLLSMVVAVTVTGDYLDEPLEDDATIELINNISTTWKAGRNFPPHFTKAQFKNLLGARANPEPSSLPVLADDNIMAIKLPVEFDARKKWKKCISLQTVRNQGACGSCWAVAAADTFASRLCVASKTRLNVLLSVEELMSCCKQCGNGCIGGGQMLLAWEYLMENGIVSGGDFNSSEGCQPYTIPPDRGYKYIAPLCEKRCYNPSYKTYSFNKDHHFVKSAFKLPSVVGMQREIFLHGPVAARFDVYEDFFYYKTGVYKHIIGKNSGGHAVKVVGWGLEEDIPYWLVANSWGRGWGDEGFFKIRRGTDEGGIEAGVVAGYPKV